MNLDAIGIVSSNLVKSIEFYKLLGISLKECGGPEHLEGKTSSGLRIMVDSEELVKKINPEWKKPVGDSKITLCFLQSSAREVDTLCDTIKSAGFEVSKEPWDAFWGQRYAYVKDPDGNQIDLFANL